MQIDFEARVNIPTANGLRWSDFDRVFWGYIALSIGSVTAKAGIRMRNMTDTRVLTGLYLSRYKGKGTEGVWVRQVGFHSFREDWERKFQLEEQKETANAQL